MVVKKKKPVPLRFEQLLAQELAVFRQQAQARAEIAQRAYDAQDKETKLALDSMVDRIVSISRGVATFNVRGKKVAAEVPTESIKHNALYLATEILKDLAMLDIRIANFRFDPARCSECGKPIKRRAK